MTHTVFEFFKTFSNGRAFSSGIVGTESQEKVLSELNYKVREAYKKCMGEQDASLPTLMMLTNMENKLESLFESIELISPDKIEQAEKVEIEAPCN